MAPSGLNSTRWGSAPTGTGADTVSVAVPMMLIVESRSLVTYTWLPSGLTAIPEVPGWPGRGCSR